MKYQGKITDPKDLVTKEYVDTGLSGKLGTSGDGSNVTAAFDAASSRTNISTGEKLTVIFGKIAKWFADLGAAAFRGVDSVPTDNSTNLVESGGIKSALNSVEDDIAIRVSGDKTTYASGAAIGQYVIVDGSTITGVTDGLYKAAKAIPYNTVIDSTYLTAVSGGGLNDLMAALDPEWSVVENKTVAGNATTWIQNVSKDVIGIAFTDNSYCIPYFAADTNGTIRQLYVRNFISDSQTVKVWYK